MMQSTLQILDRNDALTAPHQTLKFSRRQALYHNGDDAQSVFRMRDGLVRITRMTPEGRTLTVRHVLPGDFFGEEVFRTGTREEMAEALTTAHVEAIDPNRIDQGDLMTITQSLSIQMQRVMDDEYHLQTGDLRQRVARYLLTALQDATSHDRRSRTRDRLRDSRTDRRGHREHTRERLENHHRASHRRSHRNRLPEHRAPRQRRA